MNWDFAAAIVYPLVYSGPREQNIVQHTEWLTRKRRSHVHLGTRFSRHYNSGRTSATKQHTTACEGDTTKMCNLSFGTTKSLSSVTHTEFPNCAWTIISGFALVLVPRPTRAVFLAGGSRLAVGCKCIYLAPFPYRNSLNFPFTICQQFYFICTYLILSFYLLFAILLRYAIPKFVILLRPGRWPNWYWISKHGCLAGLTLFFVSRARLLACFNKKCMAITRRKKCVREV